MKGFRAREKGFVCLHYCHRGVRGGDEQMNQLLPPKVQMSVRSPLNRARRARHVRRLHPKHLLLNANAVTLQRAVAASTFSLCLRSWMGLEVCTT